MLSRCDDVHPTRRPYRTPLQEHAGCEPLPREHAEQLVNEFASHPAGGVFKRIDRARLAINLLDRVHDPNGIAQGNSSLCGPAALVRAVAFVDPVGYVRYVTRLYETGTGEIRRLRVRAGDDLRAYDPGWSVPPADWIALASLRDSENWFFDYQKADNEFAGITLPSHMASWFEKVGFREVVNDTNLVLHKPEDNLRAASALYEKDYWVCLLIDMKLLKPTKESNFSTTANHWVTMTSVVRIKDGSIAIEVYSWADGHIPVPRSGTDMPLSVFLKNYYGYVAARR